MADCDLRGRSGTWREAWGPPLGQARCLVVVPRLRVGLAGSGPNCSGSGQWRRAEIELSSAVVTVHHAWQPKRSTRQPKPLGGTAIGARAFGRLEDFALLHPDDAEREAREHRARHEDEVNQWDGKRDQGRDEPRANDAR